MSDGRIRLGTSSWTGEGWIGSFYPTNTKPQDFLQIYSREFDTVEIDSTFYRVPSAKTVEQWRERTPQGFTFTAKVPQQITHAKMLLDAEDDLKAFEKVMDLLGDKLGPLLLQFPYFNKQKFRGVGFFLERLEPFLKQLPKDHKWVVEVRNKNWLSEKLYSVLRRHGVALALVDHAWMPRPRELFETGDPVTADFTYIRFLGDRKRIEEITTVWNKLVIDRTEEMEEWLPAMQKLLKLRLTIYAYQNNHYGGAAFESARLLSEMLVRTIGRYNAETARPSSDSPRQTMLF
ncbi:MAG: DUF72 domain-containing protein [Acidobacteria bacterium]|nr:MAG: DUF72 domain-containing protein [Acidobacteriota bacterium]